MINKTANIINGPVVLRRHVDIEDGFYDINLDGSLSPVNYHYGLRYPDVETVKPPFKKMKPCCIIENRDIGRIMAFADEVFKKRGTIVVNKTSVYCNENKDVGLSYPFGLTFPIRLNPRHFSIVMVEMLQYPHIKVLREIPSGTTPETEEVTTPLLIGVDWGSCGLIMPYRGYYSG